MLSPEILETNPEMFIRFIQDKTMNNSNELTQIKDISKSQDKWKQMKFDNKKLF